MPKDCHDTALSYLEHRERSFFEMKSHLMSKGFQEEEIRKELQYLEELHYLDDERYCADYLEYGMQKGRGPVRLQFELKEKGIGADKIQKALEESFDRSTEKEAAMREAQKLLNRMDGSSHEGWKPEEKLIAKIARKLASLGYHTEVIYDILGQIRKSQKGI